MEDWHRTKIRVRLSETDVLGTVYYSRFLEYFDVARVEMFRELGIPLSPPEYEGLRFLTAETMVRYLSPARFDDELDVYTSIERIGKSSIKYLHVVERSGQRLAEGYVIDVLVDEEDRPREIPFNVREKLSKYASNK